MVPLDKHKDALKKFEETAAACNRCGFCTSYCPTYISTGSEAHSPRGRNQTFRALLEGKIVDPAKTKDIIDTCLLCGECTSVCFSEVPTAQLMVQARNYINQTSGIPKGLKFVLNVLIPKPQLLYWATKIAFAGKKLGLSWLLRKTTLLKRFAPTLDSADALLDDVSLKFSKDHAEVKQYLESTFNEREHAHFLAVQKATKLRDSGKPIPEELKKKATAKPKRPKLALLPVCGSQYLKSSITLSTLKILKKLGKDFIIPENSCCGLPAASYGEISQVKSMAEQNMKHFKNIQYDAVIADDSSCMAHFKEYPTYFGDNGDVYQQASEAVSKFKEFSAYLVDEGFGKILSQCKWSGGKVAYHDPCKAQYAQKITNPPRVLLTSIPGMKLVDVPDSDQCCGGGGTYSFVHPEMSQDVLSRKIKTIASTKCGVVVTSSTSCMIQLEFGMRKFNTHIEVLHISEFLARVLESAQSK